MASPSEPRKRKEGIRCPEPQCDKLILGKDDLAVMCPKGHRYPIPALLREAIERGYLNGDEVKELLDNQKATKEIKMTDQNRAQEKTTITQPPENQDVVLDMKDFPVGLIDCRPSALRIPAHSLSDPREFFYLYRRFQEFESALWQRFFEHHFADGHGLYQQGRPLFIQLLSAFLVRNIIQADIAVHRSSSHGGYYTVAVNYIYHSIDNKEEKKTRKEYRIDDSLPTKESALYAASKMQKFLNIQGIHAEIRVGSGVEL